MNTRTEYVERLSAQMVEWDVQIEQLRDRAKSVTFGAESEFPDQIAALQVKRDEIALKLQGISSANDDEWEELKSGTEKVWSEIRTMVSDTITNIK
jgi:hypothetical protein